MNNKIADCDAVYKPLLAALQQTEESRIALVRQSFENFAKYFEQMGFKIISSTGHLTNCTSLVCKETDTFLFVSTNKTDAPFHSRAQFEPYKQKIQSEKALTSNTEVIQPP